MNCAENELDVPQQLTECYFNVFCKSASGYKFIGSNDPVCVCVCVEKSMKLHTPVNSCRNAFRNVFLKEGRGM